MIHLGVESDIWKLGNPTHSARSTGRWARRVFCFDCRTCSTATNWAIGNRNNPSRPCSHFLDQAIGVEISGREQYPLVRRNGAADLPALFQPLRWGRTSL